MFLFRKFFVYFVSHDLPAKMIDIAKEVINSKT